LNQLLEEFIDPFSQGGCLPLKQRHTAAVPAAVAVFAASAAAIAECSAAFVAGAMPLLLMLMCWDATAITSDDGRAMAYCCCLATDNWTQGRQGRVHGT
jgi:hypothetical protein